MNEELYEDYKIIVNSITVYYAWAKIPVELLQTQIPQSALNGTYGVDKDGNPKKTNVTLEEFSLGHVLIDDGANALVTLGAQFAPCYRTRPVELKDIEKWDTFFTAYGYGLEDDCWFTKDEYSLATQEALDV